MADLVRAAALNGYFDVMAELGADPRPFLREQGLNADIMSNPEHLIPAQAGIRLLENSAAATQCIALGLRMAEKRSLANLGATSLLIAHQPSLRHALEALTEFRVRINSTLVLTVEHIGDEVILREDFALKEPEPSRQSANLALGVLARLCQSVLGQAWEPRTVCFAHERLPTPDLPIIQRLFHCGPEFDCEFNGILLPRTLLDRPNERADAQLANHARFLLDAVLSPAAQSTVQDVDQLIKLLLPAGRATIQTCAASLAMTVRTLQRRLDEEGDSFSAILNRARMQLATQFLANRRMRITDIADMLGYSSIGAFTRWHKETYGLSPREARKAL